jgi:hypothetical protein
MAIKPRLIVNRAYETDAPGTHSSTGSLCRVLERCGSCPRLDEPYTQQIAEKNQNFHRELAQCLAQYGHKLPLWNDPVESPARFAYRHVVDLSVSWRLDAEQKPWVDLGYYKKDLHSVVDIGRCPVQSNYLNNVLAWLRATFKEHVDLIANPKSPQGFIKNITLKTSHFNRQTMVIFRTLGDNPEEEARVLRPLARALRESLAHVQGVFIEQDMVCLAGQEYFKEKYGSEVFNIHVSQQIFMNPQIYTLHLQHMVQALERVTDPLDHDQGIWVYESGTEVWQAFLKPLGKPVYTQSQAVKVPFDTLILPIPRYGPADISEKSTHELMKNTAKNPHVHYALLYGAHPGRLAGWADIFLQAKFSIEQAWLCDTAPGTNYGECVLVLKKDLAS